MVTIVLTNRNRDQDLIDRCLKSLDNQTNTAFKCIVVDYGSRDVALLNLKENLGKYANITLISCNTSKQLWCKSRAINIALKQCKTPWFFVGDIDMMYHPNFVDTLYKLNKIHQVIYFQVGFLTEKESILNKEFDAYRIKFKSNKEATGMTLFNTKLLKSISGYDEFYHGWGGEDTDVHVRLQKANITVAYYDDNIMLLHQWHPKMYRSKDSLEPYHYNLELINHKYLEYVKQSNISLANSGFKWGYYNDTAHHNLKIPDEKFSITNELADVKGFINNTILNKKDTVILLVIQKHLQYNTINQYVKKLLNKKVKTFIPMQDVNNILLEVIITNFRNSEYEYTYNISSAKITLVINL